jgi:hypothetical protein
LAWRVWLLVSRTSQMMQVHARPFGGLCVCVCVWAISLILDDFHMIMHARRRRVPSGEEGGTPKSCVCIMYIHFFFF